MSAHVIGISPRHHGGGGRSLRNVQSRRHAGQQLDGRLCVTASPRRAAAAAAVDSAGLMPASRNDRHAHMSGRWRLHRAPQPDKCGPNHLPVRAYLSP